MCSLPLPPSRHSPSRSCNSPLLCPLHRSRPTMPNQQQLPLRTPGWMPEVRIGTFTAKRFSAGPIHAARLFSAKVAACTDTTLPIAGNAGIRLGTPPATIATATRAWVLCPLKRPQDSPPSNGHHHPHQYSSSLRQRSRKFLHHRFSSRAQLKASRLLTG